MAHPLVRYVLLNVWEILKILSDGPILSLSTAQADPDNLITKKKIKKIGRMRGCPTL